MICNCALSGTDTCIRCRSGREDKIELLPSIDYDKIAEYILRRVAESKRYKRDCYK